MLLPESWRSFRSLVAGFGDRVSRPPVEATRVRQVHGNAVVVCDELGSGDHLGIAGDALVATTAGVLVAVKTADCVPILILAPESARYGWVAAVHAGWRGSVANAAGAAIADAVQRGHRAETLLAAIGPAIGRCCYEVDEDVAAHFRRAGLPTVDTPGKPHLDLRAINRELLIRAGLRAENIEECGPCTRCRIDRYHSFRASPLESGRQQSWIGWTS
jgi:YfiH family protein